MKLEALEKGARRVSRTGSYFSDGILSLMRSRVSETRSLYCLNIATAHLMKAEGVEKTQRLVPQVPFALRLSLSKISLRTTDRGVCLRSISSINHEIQS